MSMKQAKWLVATLLILGVLTYLWGRAPSKISTDVPVSGALTQVKAPDDCSLKGEGCTVSIDELGAFRVTMPETVVPLEKFAFTVAPQGEVARSVGAIRVDFEMVGMDMGINAYRLERLADGQYRATIILPVCTTDRSDWLANLTIHSTEGAYLVRLPFAVDRSRPSGG
ncbi:MULTISPECIES: hypothetical protein [unclassified Guyparkeria]|uniref:hypothetical protein n=1 Tax=unclassified Guyparkeria TaxID=2626246 RepID=UPI00073379E5|nr:MULTISPECIES: hypothetical protein [unclassified Guyparkeria]KTG17383.1 hypothetical protein AUR63_09570 [Guyparkeria sp. XI15]OAE87360.1 hypothetical protein AWR35_09590 [Guyparkeria sp. WRN-7]